MPITSSSGLGLKKLTLNIYRNMLEKEMRQRTRKQALLHKIYDANSKRTKALDDVLTESDNLNKMKRKVASDPTSAAAVNATNPTKSEQEFLEKFRNMPKGGPTHSIAVSRKNHLTNFLSGYILNGFESGLFEKPDCVSQSESRIDSNGFVKNKYAFEVSHVELKADMTALKIHWLISGCNELDNEIESFLEKRLKSQIRSTLTNERVLNYVPQIVFVRDANKVFLEKLDEHLIKIKIELEQEKNKSGHEETSVNVVEETNVTQSQPKIKPKNLVENVYGVEFGRLLESIKKSTTNVSETWSEKNDMTSLENKAKLDNDLAQLDEIKRKEKFEADLKAFQINKRLQHQRMSKSAILKIAQIEFENYRDREANLNNGEEIQEEK